MIWGDKLDTILSLCGKEYVLTAEKNCFIVVNALLIEHFTEIICVIGVLKRTPELSPKDFGVKFKNKRKDVGYGQLIVTKKDMGCLFLINAIIVLIVSRGNFTMVQSQKECKFVIIVIIPRV